MKKDLSQGHETGARKEKKNMNGLQEKKYDLKNQMMEFPITKITQVLIKIKYDKQNFTD